MLALRLRPPPQPQRNAQPAALPHFRDDVWAMPPPPAAPASKEEVLVYKQEEDTEDALYSLSTTAEVYPSTSLTTTTHNIPSAPFANAGPPGVSLMPKFCHLEKYAR